MTDRTVSVAFVAKVQGFVGGIATMGAATKEFGGELDKVAKSHKEKFASITNVALGAGAALTGVAAVAIKTAMAFDKTMSGVQAVANANNKQLGQLREAAIQTGKATAFSASDAAQAEQELAKAGVSVQNILGGALTGTVNLAAAGQINLADAATDTAQALNIFGLRGQDASHVADVLTAAANTSATDVGHMAQSINQAGLVAHQTGLSLEDTAGTLALFAQNGLVGSDAGTSFKTMLQALQAPSGVTKKLMDSLGISAYNAGGSFIGITALADQLQRKLGGLTQAQRDAALAQIFGSDAVRSADILYEQGAAGVQKWIDGVNNSGIAAKTAKVQMNNLSGDIEQLKGSLETLAIESSGGATKGLRFLTQGLTGIANVAVDLPTPITATVTALSGIAGVALLGASGFVKVKGAAQNFLTTLTEMGPAGERAATSIGKIGGFLGKATLWGAAAFAAYEGVHALLGYLDREGKPASYNIDALTKSLTEFAQSGKEAGELSKLAGGTLDQFAAKLANSQANLQRLQNAQANMSRIGSMPANSEASASQIAAQYSAQYEAAQKAYAQNAEGIKALDQSLSDLVKGGDAKDALTFFSQESLALQQAGFSLGQINQLFPTYTQAAADAASGNQLLTKSVAVVTTAQGSEILSMGELITKGIALSDAVNALSGANEDYAKANIAAEQAIDDLSKALKTGKKTLNENTQAGRDHMNAILNSIDADKAAFQATYKKKSATEGETGALRDATKQYNGYIDRLRTALLNEGYSKTAVDKLLGSYAKIPPVKTTKIKTPGLVTANDTASGYARILNDIPKNVSTNIGVHVSKQQIAKVQNELHRAGVPNRYGGVYEHAADGALNQAGIYSAAMGPARYAFAEPSTGGEAFIPKNGDYGRNMSILGQAAAWNGATLIPGLRSPGGIATATGASYHYETNVYPQRADFDARDLAQAQLVQQLTYRDGRPG